MVAVLSVPGFVESTGETTETGGPRGGRHPLRVCRAYHADGQRLTRIVPGPERGLRWQEQLTGTLLRAHPVYDDQVRGDPGQDWPGIFEEMLGAPVVLRSYGPTAAGMRVYQAARTGLFRSTTGLARRRRPGGQVPGRQAAGSSACGRWPPRAGRASTPPLG
jgi:hypothetical protein